MHRESLKNHFDISALRATTKARREDIRLNPYHMRVFGTSIFCGAQGQGKTLSAVQYVLKLRERYPMAILVSNVAIKDYPFNTVMKKNHETQEYYLERTYDASLVTTESIIQDFNDDVLDPVTIEYTGLDMLKYISNAEYGVIFLIDELHLELNSLESKNIDIEIIVEISQQRKQRKHIVGTSQIFMRLAKPIREQIYDIVLCSCWLECVQYNKWINGATAVEKNGKLEAEVKGRYLWTHSPEMYEQYDTYTKMRRYNKEWNGRKRVDNFYKKEADYIVLE